MNSKCGVEGIRTSIETQLVSGTVDAGQLMKGIGKQIEKEEAWQFWFSKHCYYNG
jgi:hypothetical protein